MYLSVIVSVSVSVCLSVYLLFLVESQSKQSSRGFSFTKQNEVITDYLLITFHAEYWNHLYIYVSV